MPVEGGEPLERVGRQGASAHRDGKTRNLVKRRRRRNHHISTEKKTGVGQGARASKKKRFPPVSSFRTRTSTRPFSRRREEKKGKLA